jgi:glycosyltransferase involved in cell wall biosynthesis
MTLKPKISVVMPAYNAEKYISDAIRSILDQSFPDFEFIIINDGSTDKTSAIIQTYVKKDSRIRVITHKDNQGLIAVLNIGFRLAKGKYIARMDADDISLPDRFLKQYRYLEEHPQVVIIGSLVAYIDEESRVCRIDNFLLNDREIRTEISLRNQFCHGAVMIRRDVVSKKHELYDKTAVHYEDYDYWPRVLQHGQGVNVPEVLYYYRRSSTSITSYHGPVMMAGAAQVRLRESQHLRLPIMNFNGAMDLFVEARKYKPAYININGKRLPTHLKSRYQIYLSSVSRLYIKKSDYKSAALYLGTCFCVNPFRFIYRGFISVYHSINDKLK